MTSRDNNETDNALLTLSVPPQLTEGTATAGQIMSTASINKSDGTRSFSLINNTGAVYAISAAGVVSLTVAGAALVNAGNDLPVITVTANYKNSLLSKTVTVPLTIDVNDAPVLSLSTPPTLTEGTATAGQTISTASATDEDGNPLTFSLTTNPGAVYAINATTGVVTLTAAGAALVNAGNDLPAVAVTVTDGLAPVSKTVTVPLTIDAVTTVTLTASVASALENSNIFYTVSADHVVTGSPLVITLSNHLVITIPVGQSSAISTAVTVRADDDCLDTVTGLMSTSIVSATSGNHEALFMTNTVNTVVTWTAAIFGSALNDTISTVGTNDMIVSGEGNDTITDTGGNHRINAGAGDDTVTANGGNQTICAGDGNNTVTATGGSHHITSGAGNDTITATGSDTVVFSGGGNDTITTGAGNDMITGGAGADIMTGGTGADTFIFTALGDLGIGAGYRDIITDFLSGTDRIDFTGIDANTNVAGDQAFTMMGINAFSGVAGQLRYDVVGANTIFQGDVNGDGVVDFELQLTGAHTFAPTDLML